MRVRESSDGARIPVVLVTGFLGSGKTTVVNRLLKSEAFVRSAVVVNEYGEVSVDHVFIAAPRSRMRVIDGGCLCGHVHEEVASSLLDLHERRSVPGGEYDSVLIETSGLADPVPIVQILLADESVTRRYELRTVLTVADGVHGARHLAQHVESLKQATVADILVLSKTDLAAPAALDRLAGELAALNPGARQIRAARGMLDPAAVLKEESFSASGRCRQARRWLNDRSYAQTAPSAASDASISTFTLEYDREITLPGFVLWMNLLAGFRGAGLLRVKGIVNVEGRPYAVQAVQTVISEPVPLDDWPDDDQRSRLVFITRHMDAADIRRTLAAFNFDAGRQPRNMKIDTAHYTKFKQTIELFRDHRPADPACRNEDCTSHKTQEASDR